MWFIASFCEWTFNVPVNVQIFLACSSMYISLNSCGWDSHLLVFYWTNPWTVLYGARSKCLYCETIMISLGTRNRVIFAHWFPHFLLLLLKGMPFCRRNPAGFEITGTTHTVERKFSGPVLKKKKKHGSKRNKWNDILLLLSRL